MKNTKAKEKIIIIGGGPTGVTLACQLIKQGIPCRIVEKRKEQTTESKAINVSAASLQMFERMGIASRFMANGRQVKHVYAHWENKRLVHINYNLIDSPYSFFLSMPQATTERIISGYLEELGGKIERNIEFVDAEVKGDQVEVVLKHEDGSIERDHCDYMIASDGARSTVRSALNVPFTGHDYHQHYYLLDGFADWDGPKEDTHYYVTEKGYFIIAPMVGGYHRMVIFDESKGTVPGTMELYQELIDLYGPGKFRLKEVLWNSKGFFYNRLIDNFRYKKRIFFAGDAAHVFSPLGGHGMNSCLQDVDNLAWKLAGVINKGWDDRILDTYNEERKLIAGRLIKATDFSTRLINKIEKEFTGNIVNWFPLLRNRDNLRRKYPYQFSGLAQQYQLSEFVQTRVPLGEDEKIVGSYLPYSGNLKLGEKAMTTYQLSKEIPVILNFGAHDEALLSTVKPYGFKVYNFDNETAGSAKNDNKQSLTIQDVDNSLMKKCFVEKGDLLLLRPDGMIGFKGHRSCLEDLGRYCHQWYAV